MNSIKQLHIYFCHCQSFLIADIGWFSLPKMGWYFNPGFFTWVYVSLLLWSVYPVFSLGFTYLSFLGDTACIKKAGLTPIFFKGRVPLIFYLGCTRPKFFKGLTLVFFMGFTPIGCEPAVKNTGSVPGFWHPN